MTTIEAIGTSSAFLVATQDNIHKWIQLFRELVQRNGLGRLINPSVLERTAAREEHVDPSARPENARPTWISIDAFKASELATNPEPTAEAREKRDKIVLHLVVLYKEACIEFQRRQKALDMMLTWIDNSVPAGQSGLIFASVDRLDIYARSEIIVSRFMSTHHNGLVNCISTLQQWRGESYEIGSAASYPIGSGAPSCISTLQQWRGESYEIGSAASYPIGSGAPSDPQ